MTPEDFDAHFDRFTSTVFRLETLQNYAGSEKEVAAFLEGLPRTERSVRTSRWLARIAVTTVAGKQWQRVRVVEEPLNTYTQFELAGYVESQAAGEEIRIMRRHRSTVRPEQLRHDFWLFDARTPEPFALLMDYAPDGRFRDAELTTNPAVILACENERELALSQSLPLNEYLAGKAAKAA